MYELATLEPPARYYLVLEPDTMDHLGLKIKHGTYKEVNQSISNINEHNDMNTWHVLLSSIHLSPVKISYFECPFSKRQEVMVRFRGIRLAGYTVETK